MRFRIAAAQFAPDKGQIEANLDTIAEIARQASAENVELVVFAETVTAGYLLEGGVLENSLPASELFDRLQGRLSDLDRPLDMTVGFYEIAGGNLYNSCAYLQVGPGGRLVHVYRKFFLPTYGVFDEERFVSRGHELGVFDTRLGRTAILICEDVWHTILSALCAVRGAHFVLIPSASPARGFSGDTIGNLDRYGRMLRALCDEHGVYAVNSHLIGFEGGKGFVGGSSIVDPFGRTIAQAPGADPALVIGEVDTDLIQLARAQLPLTSDLQSAWADIRRIVSETEPND
jgi:N-carbamoylputrescine amidase